MHTAVVDELISFGACDSGKWTYNWDFKTPSMEAMIGAREIASRASRLAVTKGGGEEMGTNPFGLIV